MASLKDIRRRISSVKNTQQITKAMKLVAASRLRRAQQAISSARPFAEKLEAMTLRVVSEITGSMGAMDAEKTAKFLTNLHPLLSTGHVASDSAHAAKNKIAVIVVSSDRGLCGAYNGSLTKYAVREITEMRANPNNDVHLFFYGKKAYDLCIRKGIKGELTPGFWQGKFAPSKTDKIAAKFTEMFLSGEFNSIQVIFTQFKSVISQTPMTKQVLPLAVEAAMGVDQSTSKKATESALPFIYEPSRENVLATLLPSLIKTQFYRLFADSLASEFGARMTAMDNATRNAGGMISRLTLEANRVRQAGITRELMEIVGGAEAIKG